MIELKGKYCKDCKIFIDEVEDEAMSLVYNILDSPAFGGQKIRCMPDIHAGKGIVIGFTSTIGGFVNPEHIGVDIGCTVSAFKLSKKVPIEKYADFEHKVRNAIKFGFDIHDKSIVDTKAFMKFLSSEFSKAKASWNEMVDALPDSATEEWVSKQLKRLGMDEGTFYKSLGTIGGGNHFYEYDECEDEAIIVAHCGSRNFGVKVFNYWNKIAKNPSKIMPISSIVELVKSTEPDKTKWGTLIKEKVEEQASKHPAGYLYGDALKGYLCDMVFAQAYAKFNHEVIHGIAKGILAKYGIKAAKKAIVTTHNYIDFDDKTIRKGAVKSYAGKELLVPFNMKDGIALCEGLSNPDWNNSCSHGAGRKLSRSKAFSTLSIDEFEKEMDGIYSTSVCQSTLDESPMAYKDYETIKSLIEGTTVKIISMYKPKINWKSTSSEAYNPKIS